MASKDFFLNPDEAQTLGDINYMKKSVRVRHTFPKNLKNPNGFEIVKEVSSSQDITVNGRSAVSSTSNYTTPTSSFSNQVETAESQTNDTSAPVATNSKGVSSSMDMFRNMARNLGGR